jgi:hypothetical protein
VRRHKFLAGPELNRVAMTNNSDGNRLRVMAIEILALRAERILLTVALFGFGAGVLWGILK